MSDTLGLGIFSALFGKVEWPGARPKSLLFGVSGVGSSAAGVDARSAKRGFGVVGVWSPKALLSSGAPSAVVATADVAICDSVVR